MPNKNLLKSYIAKAGMTQKSLAKELGISKNTLNAKICGHIPFNTRDICAICNLLGITSAEDKSDIFLQCPSQK